LTYRFVYRTTLCGHGVQRRQYLTIAGATITGGIGGCLGRESPSIEGTAPTLSPGTDAVVSATAHHVDRFRFRPIDTEGIEMIDTSISPSPDAQADSFPPIWSWNDPQPTVTGELALSVVPEVTAGEYSYGVSVSNGDEQAEKRFVGTIE
jgi:hypothetical protein